MPIKSNWLRKEISRRDGTQREVKKENETLLTEHMPGVFPKNEGPSFFSIKKRMCEQLLGTSEMDKLNMFKFLNKYVLGAPNCQFLALEPETYCTCE
ncbi:hypothetical protein K2173_021012 [Erythroxylum novogranatense]|uniref:Uncharacterized protein n=1 Tax=Erythroxylum novogranatense TaxID=1862640 RepID=A0AAV8TMC9_9ROSI|nr:hypothetical protein K2173_021012 [Erythroxylum novogranatense]